MKLGTRAGKSPEPHLLEAMVVGFQISALRSNPELPASSVIS
jgi:hypothetical protein